MLRRRYQATAGRWQWTDSEDAAAKASRQKFERLIPGWPERDADPLYTPKPPQPWDLPVTVESIVWKKGRPSAT
jgi:hypothetical protein